MPARGAFAQTTETTGQRRSGAGRRWREAARGCGAGLAACAALCGAGCASTDPPPLAAGLPAELARELPDYAAVTAGLESNRLALAETWAQGSPDQRIEALTRARSLILDAVSGRLFPHWYGTPWDYSGTTEVPGEGSIACGYFVSTVLRDAGFRVEHRTLAQQASERIIRTLTSEAHMQRFRNTPLAEFVQAVFETGPGLYVVGLDTHAGFLLHDGGEVRFVHASPRWGVVSEPALESGSLGNSAYRVIGKVSDDETLLEKWLAGEALTTFGAIEQPRIVSGVQRVESDRVVLQFHDGSRTVYSLVSGAPCSADAEAGTGTVAEQAQERTAVRMANGGGRTAVLEAAHSNRLSIVVSGGTHGTLQLSVPVSPLLERYGRRQPWQTVNLAFSPRGLWLLAGLSAPGMGVRTYVLDAATGTVADTVEADREPRLVCADRVLAVRDGCACEGGDTRFLRMRPVGQPGDTLGLSFADYVYDAAHGFVFDDDRVWSVDGEAVFLWSVAPWGRLDRFEHGGRYRPYGRGPTLRQGPGLRLADVMVRAPGTVYLASGSREDARLRVYRLNGSEPATVLDEAVGGLVGVYLAAEPELAVGIDFRGRFHRYSVPQEH